MPELTVASTTDTQAEINKVAGATPAELTEPEVKETQEAEPLEEQPAAPPKPAESHSKVQRKIDKMARRIAELEAAQTKPAPVEQPAPAPEPVEALGTPKPTPDKFTNYEDFIEALTDWKAEQREVQRAQQEAQQAQQEYLRQTFDNYNQGVDDFKREHDDFDEVLSKDVAIYPGVQMAIMEMENGPAVAYYLGTHRDLASKLMDMSEARAMAEVGRISATLGVAVDDEPSSAPEGNEEEEEPVHRASPPPRKAVSAAPAPIKPLGGGNTKSSVPLDQLDYADFRKIRDQQQKARYRR
jgi:hypothetical protein